MPRELPELAGEPLGWDMFKMTQADGSETRIERAFCINDICRVLPDSDKQMVLICFFTSQVQGPCVAALQIMDLEGHLLSEKVGVFAAKVDDVLNQRPLGQHFVSRLNRFYDLNLSSLHQLIRDQSL